ncbi:EcsC family protein [Planktotalea sp.]|uniref:EcsC family protein n=1 Tax=Planktotalea sp. TaxID=2029877 RepID=UPI0025E51E2A|nr:EcsC family protein [Planktotalea sp.]
MSTDLVPTDLDHDITLIARRYRRAGGVGIQVLNLVGGQAENLLERLPDTVKDRLEDATNKALNVALIAATRSRGIVPDQSKWLNTAAATAMGAAGGAGGLPTALAELPVTTTVLLRAIQGIAAEYGFDPLEPNIQAECLQVFAAAGPLANDDGADMGFLSARVTLSGTTVQGIIARIAPRLSAALGQKLAAQAIPIIGAVAGAATNYAYTSYYQEMAHVHFGLLRTGEKHGVARDQLILQLSVAVQQS